MVSDVNVATDGCMRNTRMLAAFIILMAAKSPSNDSSKLSLGGHQQALSDHGEQPRAQQPKALRKKAARAARVARPVKPRPTHFLSVRINNPTIWRKVAMVQQDVIEKHANLLDAAIPVQDLHVTLFVATLREEDGSLERARKTLDGCNDIIREFYLMPEETNAGDIVPPSDGEDPGAQRVLGSSSVSPNAGECCDNVGRAHAANEVECEISSTYSTRHSPRASMSEELEASRTPQMIACKRASADDKVLNPEILLSPLQGNSRSGINTPARNGPPLTLKFRGLGTFGKRVLYARLVDDEEAKRFRRLTSALHERFTLANLVEGADKSGSGDDGTVGRLSAQAFTFEPHLTVIKTSKLKNRRACIPADAYEQHLNCEFGSYAPTAIELSSMLEREPEEEASVPMGWNLEDYRAYYKCECRLALSEL